MEYVKLKVSAKVNLTLDVTSLRNDGYHNIESIFQSVGIYDVLTVTKIDKPEILISCSDSHIPCGKKNIVYKAAEIFFAATGINGGVAVHIKKNIPSQAGLGGGSSDGAGVLYAMNMLYNAGLDGRKLTDLGGKVSADTAFFTIGGTAFVNGIGDHIQSIRSIQNIDIVIAKGNSGISTPQAYRKIDELETHEHIETQKLLKYIDCGKFLSKCELCENIFEKVTNIEDVRSIRNTMRSNGALNALMSGSGSSVFGIFQDTPTAEKCADILKHQYPFAVYCKTVPDSIIVLERSDF